MAKFEIVLEMGTHTILKRKTAFQPYIVVGNYNKEKEEWVGGDYCSELSTALVCLLRREHDDRIKSEMELRSGIPYAELAEVATHIKDALEWEVIYEQDDREKYLDYIREYEISDKVKDFLGMETETEIEVEDSFKCTDCPYYYVDDGDYAPCCHYEDNDGHAPCEEEKESEDWEW